MKCPMQALFGNAKPEAPGFLCTRLHKKKCYSSLPLSGNSRELGYVNISISCRFGIVYPFDRA